MKIKEGYELKQIGEHPMVVRSGEKKKLLFALNETGCFLWNGIQAGLTKEALLDAMMKEYEAEPREKETMLRDLEEFLEQLAAMGVLE